MQSALYLSDSYSSPDNKDFRMTKARSDFQVFLTNKHDSCASQFNVRNRTDRSRINLDMEFEISRCGILKGHFLPRSPRTADGLWPGLRTGVSYELLVTYFGTQELFLLVFLSLPDTATGVQPQRYGFRSVRAFKEVSTNVFPMIFRSLHRNALKF